MKNTIINNQSESELLFAVLTLTSQLLNLDIGDIAEDWSLNKQDRVHEIFNGILPYIVYNDIVTEKTLQGFGINGTNDLIEFYELYTQLL